MFGTVLQNGFLGVKMSHVLEKFPIKLFFDAFVYSFLGLYYLIDVLSVRKRVLKLPFNSASK